MSKASRPLAKQPQQTKLFLSRQQEMILPHGDHSYRKMAHQIRWTVIHRHQDVIVLNVAAVERGTITRTAGLAVWKSL